MTQQCTGNKLSISLIYKNILRISRASTDDIGCMHYFSIVHSCHVRRVLYGNTNVQ